MLEKIKLPHIIIAFIVLLVVLNRCTNNNIEGENKQIKKEIKKNNKEIDGLATKKDSVEEIIKKTEKEIEVLNKENKDLKAKIRFVKTNLKKTTFNLNQAKDFINKRYKTDKVTEENNALVVGDSIPSYICSELRQKDTLQKYSEIQEYTIAQQDTTISKQYKVNKELKVGLNLAEEQIKKEKENKEYYEELTKNQGKQITKQKRKSLLDKVIIGVGVYLGYLIGKGF